MPEACGYEADYRYDMDLNIVEDQTNSVADWKT